MLYKRINAELIVVADEAKAVVAELEAALDQLKEKHTLFGGGIETIAFRAGNTGGDPRSRIPWPRLGQP